MRLFFLLAGALALTSCSETAVETKAKKYADPLPPVTGRMAFQSTYPSARGWAPDAEPMLVRSMNLAGTKAAAGKAGLWEVTYVSKSKAAARVFTWSAMEDDKLHQGVYAGPQQSFGGSSTQRAFPPAALRSDTDEAFEKAQEASEAFLKTPGDKPEITYLLESTSRFPNPVWRVLWGVSVGSAKRQVFVDATLGEVVGKE